MKRTPKTPPKSAGRPRSQELEPLVLKATFDLLAQKGYHGFSMDDLVAKTGVAKTTIYRRWPNKAKLAMDTMTSMIEPFLGFADDIPFSQALFSQMEALSRIFSGKLGKVISALIGAGQEDQELASSILKDFLSPRRAAAKAFFQKAIESGRIKAMSDPEIEACMDLLYGSLYFRLLLKHEKPTIEDLKPWMGKFLESLRN